MTEITLLQTRTMTIRNLDHLKFMIRKHREQLGKTIMNLDDPKAVPIVQAISYNLVHLTREFERRQARKGELKVFPGGKTED